MSFQLDTSGSVSLPASVVVASGNSQVSPVTWSDLSPFAQGYVEAMFAGQDHPGFFDIDAGQHIQRGFRHLHRSALALILKDCELWEQIMPAAAVAPDADDGREFWRLRQADRFHVFPPLLPSLDEEGKVQLSVKGG